MVLSLVWWGGPEKLENKVIILEKLEIKVLIREKLGNKEAPGSGGGSRRKPGGGGSRGRTERSGERIRGEGGRAGVGADTGGVLNVVFA